MFKGPKRENQKSKKKLQVFFYIITFLYSILPTVDNARGCEESFRCLGVITPLKFRVYFISSARSLVLDGAWTWRCIEKGKRLSNLLIIKRNFLG